MEALLFLSILLYNNYVQHDIMCVARTDKRENRPRGMVHVASPEDTRLATATKQLREQARRDAELDKQRQLLEEVDMLSPKDAIRVLQANISALVLTDADTATVKVPAFQFLMDKDGKIKRDAVTKIPIINLGVLAVFQQQSPDFGRLSKLDSANAWFMLSWWTIEMRLDVSDPESRPFRPIDVIRDATTLYALAKYLKEWREEEQSG